MKKKNYTNPALNIVFLKANKQLLRVSGEYSVNNYENGGTTTVGDSEE